MRDRADKIAEYRRRQPIEELWRKAEKAQRRAFWTQEDLDWGKAEGQRMADYFEQEIAREGGGDHR